MSNLATRIQPCRSLCPAAVTSRRAATRWGALWNVALKWQFTSNLAYTERAPRDYELFANGPHVATKGYEVGDPGLGKERGTQLDIGAAWKSGADAMAVTAYLSQFKKYIDSGQRHHPPGARCVAA